MSHCLLNGESTETFTLEIPHGKITLEVYKMNPNMLFFLKEYWRTVAKTLKTKYGSCHMGVLEPRIEVDGEMVIATPQLIFLSRLHDVKTFEMYSTPSKKYGIYAVIGEGEDKKEFRAISSKHKDVMKQFIEFLDALDFVEA
jgi:hypothetical protein